LTLRLFNIWQLTTATPTVAAAATTNFLILDLKMAICGAFLVQFFCSSAKTLRGRKDTLAQQR